LRFLITAGPTREYLDDVRFLSNASSGRMGYALARAAVRRGHRATLVSGPVTLRPPAGVEMVRVVSAEEMHRECARRFVRCDCLIGAAAPADYAPIRRHRGKLKKKEGRLSLELGPTVDILATLGAGKRLGQVLICFALESQAPLRNALRKMRLKNADAVLLNSPAAIDAVRADARVLFPDGGRLALKDASKEAIARALIRIAEALHAAG
jgi:phosphopantothenoylcysteine decarboxylase/phosphopantothenate--cysteine ligase